VNFQEKEEEGDDDLGRYSFVIQLFFCSGRDRQLLE